MEDGRRRKVEGGRWKEEGSSNSATSRASDAIHRSPSGPSHGACGFVSHTALATAAAGMQNESPIAFRMPVGDMPCSFRYSGSQPWAYAWTSGGRSVSYSKL